MVIGFLSLVNALQVISCFHAGMLSVVCYPFMVLLSYLYMYVCISFCTMIRPAQTMFDAYGAFTHVRVRRVLACFAFVRRDARRAS